LSDELVRQTERSQALSLKDLSAKGSAPIFCRISPDGERLFTMIQVGDGFKAQLWDTSSLKKIADLELPWAERTRRIPPVKPIVRSGPYVSFSSDGRFVLCWYDDELRAWDSRSGLRIVSFRTGLAGLGGSSVHIDQFAEIARDRSLLLLEGLVFDFQGNWISSCPYSGRCYSTEISPDGKRILFATSAGVLISDSHSGAHLTTFARSQDFIGLSALFDAEGRVVLLLNDGVQIYSRRRPEYWWGIAWLPEFWVALLSGGALVVIAVRRLRARKAVKQEAA
jgi:WD40 repeat protein